MRSLVTLFFLLLALSHGGASAQSTEIRGPKGADNSEHSRAIGPIKPSDTLWRIAAKVRPDNSVTMYQVMVALYEKNPNSFLDNNLNHMRDGAYLLAPSMREIRAIDPQLAKAKSEQDDKLWAKIKTGAVTDSTTASGATAGATASATATDKQASAARQQQAAQAKRELELELERLKQQQNERLIELQQQLSASVSNAESILADNERLRAQLQKITDQLYQVKAQLDEKDAELQQQLQQFMAERKAMARQQKIQQEQSANWLNALPGWLSLLLMMTLPALAILALVMVFLKKRNNEEIPSPEAQQQVSAVSQPVAAAQPLSGLDELDLAKGDDTLEDLPLDDPLEEHLDDFLDEPLDELLDDPLDQPLDEPLDEVFAEQGIQLDEGGDEPLYDDNEDGKNIDSLLEQDELDDLLADNDLLFGDDNQQDVSPEETVLQQNFDLPSGGVDALSDEEIDDLFATEVSASEKSSAAMAGLSEQLVEEPAGDELDIDDLRDDLPQEDDINFDAEDELSAELSAELLPEDLPELSAEHENDILPEDLPEPSAEHSAEVVADVADEFDIDELLDEVQGEEEPSAEISAELSAELLPEDLPEFSAEHENDILPEDLPEPSAEPSAEVLEDVTDEFDIDDLLDEVQQDEDMLDELEEEGSSEIDEAEPAKQSVQPLEDELDEALALSDDLDAGDDPLAQLDEPLDEEAGTAVSEFSDEPSSEPSAEPSAETLSEALPSDALSESTNTLDNEAVEAALDIDLGDDPLLADDDLEAQTNADLPSELVDLGDVNNPSAQLEDYPELEMDEQFSSATEQQLSEAMADSDGFDIDAMLAAEYDEDSALDDEQMDEDFLADLGETDFDAMLDELAESPAQSLEQNDVAGDLDLQALLHDADDELDDIEAAGDAIGDVSDEAQGDDETSKSATKPDTVTDSEGNYVDIDELLAQSDEAELDDEPYKDANMDVGLGEFDDLLEDTPKTDVDTEDGGYSAKLDLARAYLEIDDVDSALEALQEVLDNGPQTLQQEAQALKERLQS